MLLREEVHSNIHLSFVCVWRSHTLQDRHGKESSVEKRSSFEGFFRAKFLNASTCFLGLCLLLHSTDFNVVICGIQIYGFWRIFVSAILVLFSLQCVGNGGTSWQLTFLEIGFQLFVVWPSLKIILSLPHSQEVNI